MGGFQMAAPEYIKDRSPLAIGVYSWLQFVDLVSRHDTSEVYETFLKTNNQDLCC